MVYLVSFGIFLLFMLCMALSLIFKRGSLKSESEAHALLEGINCAACTNSACGFHGQQRRKPSKSCLQKAEIDFKQV
ncbi:MAG TPA: hypothetical protein H9850_08060 [Candidatus Anaerobiospirillum pullistercoris]|uniref:Uncharacterized protein n=1 Tax=Candidatus Anaerobiospirillum pullistercoris TaxID=2838452 RepID=A0A9D1WFT7_9GAMM|nr:hypothetical protein [Candidatus Anaerobiospirillum pullistercoris]